MFSRSKKAAKGPAKGGKAGPPGLSFIGSEVVISGDVTTSAQLHVDGRIDGSVRCQQLFQGASGIVAGDIVTEEARIAGKVEGTVSGKTVLLEASAAVSGDISYETISIAAGARVDGRLSRRDSAASELLIATPTRSEPGGKGGDGNSLFAPNDPPRLAVG